MCPSMTVSVRLRAAAPLILAAFSILLVPIAQSEAIVGPVSAEEAARPPHAVLIWVDGPKSVRVGGNVKFIVTIRNSGLKELFRFRDINFDASFVRGFDVVAVDPQPTATDRTIGDLELTFDRAVADGSEFKVQVTLKALRAGGYSGDVDVDVTDSVFYTRSAQIEVTER